MPHQSELEVLQAQVLAQRSELDRMMTHLERLSAAVDTLQTEVHHLKNPVSGE